MSAGPLVVEIICTCCLAAFLLHRYGDWKKQHLLVTLSTFVAWYFSLLIIFVLPLDVSSTYYRQCIRDHTPVTTPPPSNISNVTQPTVANMSTRQPQGADGADRPDGCQAPISHIPNNVLPALWHVVYWTSQVLTWLFLPLMQSYSTAGNFSMGGKIKTALIENAIYYGTYLLIFGICLIYVAAMPNLDLDAEKIKIIGITASNTWGLFLLVLLLGYGLVEVPRIVWNNSKRNYMLQRTQFKLSKLSTEKSEAEEGLEDILEEIKKASDKIRYNHPLRKHVDTILLKCPESMRQTVKRNVDDYEDFTTPVDTLSEKGLVKLHKQVIRASQMHRRTQCQWNMLVESAFELEDIIANESNSDRRFQRSFDQYGGIFKAIYTPSVEWYWRCMLSPWALKALSCILIMFSCMVIWSECLFFIKSPHLSIFAAFLDLATRNYDYVYIELASILTIAYLCFCAYYTVFQIRILNYYYIAPHHQTDEYSLVFTGMMLCRLTPPMCLNFLGLIYLDSHITQEDNREETSYTKIMGHMDVISIISDGFNIYFPIAIVLLCICTYFSLGSRILHFLGFQQFIGDDDMTQELTDEGKEHIRRERRKRDRAADSETRRKVWNEKFGDSSSNTSRVRELEESSYGGHRANSKVPRSPDDSDRTELLRQAEPVDYTGENPDLFEEYMRNAETSSGYQSKTGPSRISKARDSSRPPKGIFDDI